MIDIIIDFADNKSFAYAARSPLNKTRTQHAAILYMRKKNINGQVPPTCPMGNATQRLCVHAMNLMKKTESNAADPTPDLPYAGDRKIMT